MHFGYLSIYIAEKPLNINWKRSALSVNSFLNNKSIINWNLIELKLDLLLISMQKSTIERKLVLLSLRGCRKMHLL